MQLATKDRESHAEQDNAVQALVNRERNVQQFDAESPITVKLSEDGKKIQIIHNDLVLNGEVKRPLIHQLGGRAWGQNQEFDLIHNTWKNKFSFDRSELEQELTAIFRRHDLSIRYETNSRGENIIYGIVTPHFIDVNQIEFREKFIEQRVNQPKLSLKAMVSQEEGLMKL